MDKVNAVAMLRYGKPELKDAQGDLKKLQKDMEMIVRYDENELKNVKFEVMYRNAYNLTVHGFGWDVFTIVKGVLKHAALTTRRARFLTISKLINDVCLYMDAVFLVKHRLPSIAEYIEDVYKTLKKRRALLFVVRTVGLIARCKRAFDEVRLRPGASGALNLALRFKRSAAELEAL
tara:strand:+ start:399 stop:929 length:531 start_codon:yes stop_codon:yes gene_type:complete